MEDKDDTVGKLTEIESLLVQLLGLTRLRDFKQIAYAMREVLNTPEKRQVYELTDGTRTRIDIAKTAKVSERTITNWWHDWQVRGLLMRDPTRPSKLTKVFSLEDFGLNLPKGSVEEPFSEPAGLIFSPNKIREILQDKEIFTDSDALVSFASPILEVPISLNEPRDAVINKILDNLDRGPTIKQQLFIQALEQRLKTDTAAFQKYFESWERNIRG